MKHTNEMVWPVEDYTLKIHSALKATFDHFSHLAFTIQQLEERLVNGLSWLQIESDQQRQVLHRIIHTGVKKLIQLGKVVRVFSKVSVEPQWICSKTAAFSGYIVLTTDEQVAKSDVAKKFVSNRALNDRALWAMNRS